MFLSQGTLVSTKTPLSLTNGSSWFPSMPPMSGSWPSAYAGMYRRQLWVAVVVNKLAKAQARLPLPVYERGAMDRSRRDDHPMARLLRQPNPGLSGYDLQLWTSSTKDIFGTTFWYKKRGNGAAWSARIGADLALYPLHPTSMHHDDRTGLWTFDNGKTRLEGIRDADLVTFRGFDPESNVWGMSPLEPLRSTLENEWSARAATSSFWRRGARPGMALVHKGNLSEPAQDRLKKQMDDIAAGADKTGVSVVLEEGMEPKVMTLTAEEAQYIETRKLNREEVCAGYDVPPPVVHILDRATFSNITEQMRSMYRDTMGGRLPAFEAAIEIDLRQAEWPNDDVYAEFLMDEVLRGDFETRQDALNKATHMTIAEKRKVENLPFIEGTDRIFLNTATMPLDAIDAQSAAIVAQTQRSDDALAEVIPLAVARSVMGRLSWQNDLSQVDARSLTDGLTEAAAESVRKAYNAERAADGSVKGLRERIGRMSRAHIKAKAKAPDTTGHEATLRRTLSAFFERQGRDVLTAGVLSRSKWDDELADDLHATAVAVSSSIGKSAMRELGYDAGTYDVARTVDFLRAVAVRLAENINKTTADQFDAAESEDDRAAVFAKASESRAEGIAVGVTTLVSGFALVESGQRIAESDGVTPTKTWVTGRNPRASHAAMNGETVPIDDQFSNGQDWPGSGGDVEDVAGCNCSVQIEI